MSSYETYLMIKQASINSPNDLKSLYDSLAYKILDRETNKPYTETSRENFDKWRLLSPEEIQKHKIGICWDTAAMTDSELSRLGVPHENYYAHSVTDDPMAPTHSFNIYKDNDNYWKWLEGSWGKYKSNDWKDTDSKKLLARIIKALENEGGKQFVHKVDKFPTPGVTAEEFIKSMTRAPLYNSKNKAMSFPGEEINNLKGKNHLYTTRVSSDYDKYNLGDTVTTPWGDNYVIDSEDIYDDVKKHKFYNELTDEQKRLLSQYKVMKLLGLTKKASRLYTYVDPNADLSQGLLSLRNAPEDVVVRRYGAHVKDPKNRNKEYILKHFEIPGYGLNRPDLIFALDAPIPDNANEKLLQFRNTHKLVSWDPAQVKDIIKILRRYHPKRQEEVPVEFEPLKHIQWGRLSKDRTTFRYAPVYKVLTESGRIPPELLMYET